MSAPVIIFTKPQVILSETESWMSIKIDAAPFQFGQIESVADLVDGLQAGDRVMYDPTNAVRMLYEGEEYFLVDVDKVYFKETVPP